MPDEVLERIMKSTYALVTGTATWDDFVRITASSQFCTTKATNHIELGFQKDLADIGDTLLTILERASPKNEPGVDTGKNWVSPFMTVKNICTIRKLEFLLLNQFVGEPTLDINEELVIQFNTSNFLEECGDCQW